MVADTANDELALLRGNGDGTYGRFAPESTIDVPGTSPYAVTAGRINGDKLPDLVVVAIADFATELSRSCTASATDGSGCQI